MAGLLTVLKIIGIVLLWILAIVLFLILLVLFVPVRYKADVNIPETELDKGFDVEKMHIKAGFSWLLHLLSGGIDFPENKEFTVRVFGIKVFPRKSKGKKDKDKKKEQLSEEKDKTENTELISEETEEQKSEEIIEETEDSANRKEDSNSDDNLDKIEDENIGNTTDKDESLSSDNSSDNSDDATGQNSSNCTDNLEKEPEDKALIEIITDIFEKIENILKTPQTVLQKIQYTISRVCDKIGMIKTTLENDIFKRAFSLVKRKLLRILKMILPDKIRADILFGTGDPADTAEILATYSALYPVLYKKVSFEPDFDRKVIGADVHVKGHITLFTILYCTLVCYFNKDVKKTIKRFKKIISS